MTLFNRLTPPARNLDDRDLKFGLSAARSLRACGDRVVTEREAARIITDATHVLEMFRRLKLVDRIYEMLMSSAETLPDEGLEQVVYLMAAIADVDDRHAYVDWAAELSNSRIDAARGWFERNFPASDPVWNFIRR